MSYTTNLNENPRVVDYFLVCGLSPRFSNASSNSVDDDEDDDELEQKTPTKLKNNLLNFQYSFEGYDSNTLGRNRQNYEKTDPIVDLAILNKSLNESVPHGYECLWVTKQNHSANLNYSDSLFKTQHEMFLCIRRGRDKPPITDIGVFYENSERVMNGCCVITKTVGGNSANVNNSSFSGDRIFITYRRSNELACNSLAVVDVCVIIKSKGETAPHTFLEIPKNLNRGIFGASIFLCYKKAWVPAPQIKYTPSILYRYPQADHNDIPFPSEVSMFGLPMGAVIESWPKTANTNNINTKPSFGTFVLNVTSEDGSINEKVYGASLIFYEPYDDSKINGEQTLMLEYLPSSKTLHSNKCLMLLSRHPLFDSFKEFLLFLYNNYTKSLSLKDLIPIEKYLSHLVFDVPFPTFQKPRVLVNLTDKEDDCLSIYLPDECALPQSGASFSDLLLNFGVDNSINVFLLVLLQRNVMFHSLRRPVLTGVVEAVSCIIFPFMWRYSYLPMCPLNLYQLIEAPGSFILGMDSRYFDLFDTPDNVICVDLDTNTISWTHERDHLTLKILPRKPLNILQNRLKQLNLEIEKLRAIFSDVTRGSSEQKFKRQKRYIDLAIREAFLRFMAYILQNYKQFLRTVTRRPDVKAMDRNLATFFDCDGFVQSKEKSSEFFYKELIKTQLFYDFIMNISFATELEQNLAESFDFFADCCSKVLNLRDEDRLLELNESNNQQTIVILPPTCDLSDDKLASEDESSTSDSNTTSSSPEHILLKNSEFVYLKQNSSNFFPKLKLELGLSSSLTNNDDSNDTSSASATNLNNNNNNNLNLNDELNQKASNHSDTQSNSSANTQNQLFPVKKPKVPSTPIGVRTMAEKLQAQKRLEAILRVKPSNNSKQNEKLRYNAAKTHAMCLLSNSYALWFIYLAECLKSNQELSKIALDYAYQVLIQMQHHRLIQPDEICYRTMMQLCLLYKLPTLAVKTLLHMKRYKIELTPITYSYYNKALIDPSNWPSFEQDKWGKLRLIWSVAWAFRYGLKLKKQREEKLRKASRKKRKSNNHSSRSKLATLKARSQHNNIQNNLNENKDNNITNNDNLGIQQQQVVKSNEIHKTIVHRSEHRRESTNQRHSNIYNDKSLIKRQLRYSVSEAQNKTKQSFHDCFQLISLFFNKNKQDFTEFYFNSDLLSKDAGLLAMSLKLSTKLKSFKQGNPTSRKRDLSIDLFDLDKLNINITFKKSPTKPVAALDDPLSAFEARQQDLKESLVNKNESSENQTKVNEINRRLFDYEPFAGERQAKSDFVFENSNSKPKQQQQQDSDYEYENYDEYDEEDEESDEEDEEGSQNSDEYNSDYDQDDEEYNHDFNRQNGNKSNLSTNGTIESSNEDNTSLIESCVPIAANQPVLLNGTNSHSNLLNTPTNQKNSRSNSNFYTPNASSMTSIFSSLSKKVANSIDINRIKGIINDKSSELKDAFITNVTPSLNQTELTNRFKSISNYQLYPGQYVNKLTKSATNQFTTQTNKTSPRSDTTSDNSNQTYASIDLDPFPEDDSFRSLSTNWWGFKYDGRKIDSINNDSNLLDNILIDIQMSSCNFCENCRSFLYDEELMAGWSFNESDLNVKCTHCNASLVPKLYITTKDLDSIRKYLIPENTNETSSQQNEELHPFIEPSSASNSCNQIDLNTTEFTVQYLSPLVVRKEVENIILLKKQEKHNEPLLDAEFMNEHQVVYWNLIWYFKRIGVDGGHLLDSLLNSRINMLRKQLNNQSSSDEFKYVSSFKNKIPKPYHEHNLIRLRCNWDNLKLHNTVKTYEVPLYLSWLTSDDQEIKNQLSERLITVLGQNELRSLRKSSANPRSLAKLFELIVRNIKECEVGVPIKNLLRERYIARTNYASIYRETLFLVLVVLERYLIDIDVFDTEYRKAYKRIISNEQSQHLFKSFDKPPNNLAVWCRRLFSPLSL